MDSASVYIPMAAASLKMDTARITVRDNVLRFNQFDIWGANKNPLSIDGTVDASDFRKILVDLTADARNMQLIKSDKRSKGDIFGKIYLDMGVKVKGPLQDLDVAANLNLLGTSGAGKTFTMQLLALRMRMRGIQCYILAPIKGHEFRRACNKIGGEFIKIAPGFPPLHRTVMEIRHTMSPEMELIDEIDYVEMGSMLARKIQQLMTFFGLLIPDMSNEEEQMLDEALIRTYADFGITHDNDSIYTDMASAPPK